MSDEPRVHQRPAPEPSLEDKLRALITEGMARQHSLKKSKDRLAEDQARRAAAAEARAIALAARYEWRAVASVILFERQQCACGTTTDSWRGFADLMRRQSDNTERLVKADVLDMAHPRERRYMIVSVPVCMLCVQAVEKPWTPAPYSFTPNRREDIIDATAQVH